MEVKALFFSKGSAVLRLSLLIASLALVQLTASAQVKLPPASQPPSGVAGVNTVYLTGTGFPSGVTAADVTISLQPIGTGCLVATPAPTTATALSLTHILGTTYRAKFQIPGSLATGTYSAWMTGTSPAFTSTDCSAVMVTNTSKTLEACVPSSSLAVQLGTSVDAYVPNGNWLSGVTGVQFVPIEGGGSPVSISTPKAVNACSSNSVTGETVCTANNTDVYLITGSTLNTTLTSGATGTASFSGGSCNNCGVAINAATNTAYIEEGVVGGGRGDGIQALNLASNTFSAPFPMSFAVSENIAVDATRSLILSPGEDYNYTVLQIAPNGSLSEFGNSVGEGYLDSAAEDCTTGIALSSSEFTDDVYIQDLTQAVYTAGTPGSYTAPGQFVTLDTGAYGEFSAGTSGISEAPGASHLGVVTGEFGGNTFAALQLPATSGTGTPTIVDYAVAQIPGAAVCGGYFSSGLDPHTVTAYTSPNNGKAYAVFANDGASCLAVVDLAAVLAAPRNGGGYGVHAVAPADLPAGAITFFATH
jgi:hypothetical protein